MSYSKSAKFKVGDKVVAVEKVVRYGNHYLHPYLCSGSVYEVTKVCNGIISVSGFFAKGNGENWSEDWFKPYEEKEVKAENTVTAESLRNSILSLQQERVSLQEWIEQNIAQEKALTEQLKELGFLLVEGKEQPTNIVDEKKSVLYAEDIEEDMTDPYNWQVGDILEQEEYSFKDKLTPITKIDNGQWWTRDNDAPGVSSYGTYDNMKSKFKFHSRPVVN